MRSSSFTLTRAVPMPARTVIPYCTLPESCLAWIVQQIPSLGNSNRDGTNRWPQKEPSGNRTMTTTAIVLCFLSSHGNSVTARPKPTRRLSIGAPCSGGRRGMPSRVKCDHRETTSRGFNATKRQDPFPRPNSIPFPIETKAFRRKLKPPKS